MVLFKIMADFSAAQGQFFAAFFGHVSWKSKIVLEHKTSLCATEKCPICQKMSLATFIIHMENIKSEKDAQPFHLYHIFAWVRNIQVNSEQKQNRN